MRFARGRRALLGLLLATLTPSTAAPIVSVPVHWCIHDLFSPLNHIPASALWSMVAGYFPESP
ncbi:hypothetical protein JVX91_17020 [Pseudomonas sp. PDNC002]|uniref:hypothetical protein n=1 Tax=Pseudomonas sp. PDNC002 TaxID=2811422 RepID=UPI0019629F44|nr:hypothetical protein [Pseudomonas sp. PDNC002]QRY77311.1 hypothetical protein JVX91_17020 [Pseudomonas sp. PDNC002]